MKITYNDAKLDKIGSTINFVAAKIPANLHPGQLIIMYPGGWTRS